MKAKPKPIDGTKIVEELHQKKKELAAPRNLVIKTVVITLISLVFVAFVFWLGGVYNQHINDRITLEAKALSLQK